MHYFAVNQSLLPFNLNCLNISPAWMSIWGNSEGQWECLAFHTVSFINILYLLGIRQMKH